MRRYVAGAAVVGVFAAALGCQHVAGMNDVYHHPDNAVINTGGGNPYHTTGSAIYPSNVVPTSVPDVKPMAEEKKSDEKKLDEKKLDEKKAK